MQSNSESKFIHLRCHSEYSITDGIVRLGDYVSLAKELELESLAISDLSNIFAAVKFFKLATSNGIKPIIGADVYIENEDNRDQPSRLLLICQNKQGYLNLSKLLSKAYTENQYRDRPEIKFEWLCSDLNHGLICLSGFNFGAIGQNLLSQKKEKSVKLARQLKEAFDDRFYLEVQRYEVAKKGEEQENLVLSTAQLAYELDIPLVATQPIQFIKKEDFQAHEAKTCIADGYVLGDQRRPKNFTAEQYFKTPDEMVTLFEDIPSAISNTLEIAKRCNFEFELGNVFLPDFPIPEGLTINEYLEKTAISGLEKKLKTLYPEVENFQTQEKKYLDRLHFEINVINQMGYAGYFLIVADFINWAKENNVPVGPGRGSGAGSVVAFALGITDLDPLSYNLLFERFLNPERVSMPDFDIDFCQEGRDRVIDYVKERYGYDAVSQIVTFGTMAARAVIRDVGRVLDLPFPFVDSIAKLIPMELGITLKDAIEKEEQIQQRIKKEEEVKELFDLALKLEGLVRNVGMHAGGVLIAPGKISDYSPLYCQEGGEGMVSQFDKDDVESIGLIKFDFLGLRTLTILSMALNYANKIRTSEGKLPIHLDDIPLDDEATFEWLSNANTTAVFQLESRGMKDMLKQAKPDCFEDIIALVALYRPGPMDLIPDFCKRKHGQQLVSYPHPSTEGILKETYGIAVYQEQVMQIAQTVAGYTLGGADLLRRAMGKKKVEEMDAQREVFIQGATQNGLEKQQASNLFDLLEKFAGYGFNKSHAAAYAKIAYQTAYLKRHYTSSFIAASMSADMNNTDNIALLFDDCVLNKIKLLPPSINNSVFRFQPLNDQEILYGLGAIKGTGLAAIEVILEDRNTNGPYQSLFEFCARLDLRKVNRKVIESLIRAGAFDELEKNRASLLASINQAISLAEQSKSHLGQDSLFGEEANKEVTNYVVTDEWDSKRQIYEEKVALGFYYSGHPFSHYKEMVRAMFPQSLRDARPSNNNQWLSGVVMAVRNRMTQRGKIAIVTLDDGEGRLDMIVGSKLLSTVYPLIKDDQLLIVEGKVSPDEFTGGNRVSAVNIFDLLTVQSRKTKQIKINVGENLNPEQLKLLLKPYSNGAYPKEIGRCPVVIEYQNQDGSAEIKLGDNWAVAPHENLIFDLKKSFQDENVKIIYN
ncbi:MAG: DNA polymerase III subunit alpha [Betaproteobacteria bacterium]|nr:DNA polymerase III subunit alpha [Betaproteobacteria bacterium]